jgi:hypothetical protein
MTEDIDNKMWRLNQHRIQDDVDRQKRVAAKSKTQLSSIIERKVKTTMIGAISQFEQFFGELWGYNKHASERTREEQVMYDKWMIARTNILNNGNNQNRALQNELQQYFILWQGYHYDFPVVKEDNANGPEG